MKKDICVDFDGVLNIYTHYDPNDLCEMREGCPQFLEQLSQKYRVTILTSREPISVIKWLKKHNLLKFIEDVTDRKIPAVYYIDDRAVKFDGDYNKIMQNIL
jgi:hypothetical protein